MADSLRLGDHCSKVGSGATPRGGKESYLKSGPFTLIRSQNVHNDGFRLEGLAYISHDQARLLRNVEVMAGDVLVNITGDSVARACQVDNTILPARVNQHVAIIRPDNKVVDAGFLRYWLVERRTQDLLLALASAGATRNALTKSMLEDLRLPSIEFTEQRRIADVLSSLDDKIELNRRMNETLEALTGAIFKDWFVDFGPVRRKQEGATIPVAVLGGLLPDPARAAQVAALFPDSFEDGGLPEGWNYRSLEAVCTVNDESWKASRHPDQVEYVDLSNTKWGVIESTSVLPWDQAPSRARRIAKPGDSIVGTVRPGNGSYAFISDEGYTVSTGFAVLRPRNKAFESFVYIASTRPENIARLANLADGHGGAYPAVNPSEVLGTEVAFSGDTILLAFDAIAAPIRAKIEHNKKENRTLAEARDYLLPKLMSGEVRVLEAERAIP